MEILTREARQGFSNIAQEHHDVQTADTEGFTSGWFEGRHWPLSVLKLLKWLVSTYMKHFDAQFNKKQQ